MAPALTSLTWSTGDVIVLREVLGGRIRSARPLRVLEDGPDSLVGFLAPRSAVAWPRLLGGAQSQTPDQGWYLAREEWEGPGCLFVLPASEAWAAVRFLDRDSGRPLGWKVDFLAPPRRFPAGLDTLDWALDLLAPPELDPVGVKDRDDLAQLELIGLLGEAGGERVADARRRAEARIAARAFPFGGRWAAWRPPAGGGSPLDLPPGWDRLDRPDGPDRPAEPEAARPAQLGRPGDGPAPGPPGDGGPTSRPGRSGLGSRLLDEAGRTWLDADLAGGTLLHGHAHPRIVEAVTRQVPLGLGASAAHGGAIRLGERLAERFPSVEAVTWAGSGDDAWWRAVRIARRATGRSRVACWTAAPSTGGGEHDADVVVVPPDPAAAAAVLAADPEGWAAVMVDALALALALARAWPPGPAGSPGPADQLVVGGLAMVRGALVVADERRTLGAGPAGGHGRLGLRPDLVVLGSSLFAGLGGGALVGRPELLVDRPRPGGPRRPDPSVGPGLHPVIAAAGLATLELADGTALAHLEALAGTVRSRLGCAGQPGQPGQPEPAEPAGLGGAVRLPLGATPDRLARRGLAVDRSGWAWLATVSTDEDADELVAVVAETSRSDGEHPLR